MNSRKHIMPALAGFGSADLSSALTGNVPFALEHVEAHVLFTAPGDAPEKGGIWAVLDFMDLDLSVVDTIKRKIAGKTGLLVTKIHVLTTHDHGAGEPARKEAIAELAAQAAEEAVKGARPALIRGVRVVMPPGINFRRRIHVPEFDGAWTTFAGPDMGERRSASGFIESAIRSIRQGELSYFGWEPSARPAPEFEPGDPDFFLLEFKDAENGAMLGSLSRFAMHAIMRSRTGEYFSSDYPWHIRDIAEKKIGGEALFLNGPCGDLAPCFPWPDKTSGIERVYAEKLIDTALAAIGNEPFAPLTTAHFSSTAALPVRIEVLENKVELNGKIPPVSDLPARKRWLERQSLAETLSFLREKYANGEQQLKDTITVELGALQLGKFLIAGFPGETFSGTARKAAETFPQYNIITVTEHGRTAMYMAPEEEYLAGGYESVCAVTSCKAEKILSDAAIALIGKIKGYLY